jgi:hypothetical protein
VTHQHLLQVYYASDGLWLDREEVAGFPFFVAVVKQLCDVCEFLHELL